MKFSKSILFASAVLTTTANAQEEKSFVGGEIVDGAFVPQLDVPEAIIQQQEQEAAKAAGLAEETLEVEEAEEVVEGEEVEGPALLDIDALEEEEEEIVIEEEEEIIIEEEEEEEEGVKEWGPEKFVDKEYCMRDANNIEWASYGGKVYMNRQPIHIRGVSWFGTEGGDMVVEGLDTKTPEEIIGALKYHKFNAVRLPISLKFALSDFTAVSHNTEAVSEDYAEVPT